MGEDTGTIVVGSGHSDRGCGSGMFCARNTTINSTIVPITKFKKRHMDHNK